MRWSLLLLLVAGCDRVLGLEHLPEPGAAPVDASSDAGFQCASPLVPGNYGNVSTLLAGAYAPTLADDQQLMYVGASGQLAASRYTGTAWTAPMLDSVLHAPMMNEDRPSLSYDALHLYFTRRPSSAGTGGVHVPYETTRTTRGEAWALPAVVPYPSVIGGSDVMFGVPTADGKRVVVTHGMSSRYRLDEMLMVEGKWTLRTTTSGFYADPNDQDFSDSNAQLSPDGCWLVFARVRPSQNHVIMFANRDANGDFEAPQVLQTNAVNADLQHPWLSPDKASLYYVNGTTTPSVQKGLLLD